MASIVDQYGPFLRVEEAAKLLRISRTSAYALARRWPRHRRGRRSARSAFRPLDPDPHWAIERLADADATLAPQLLRLVDAG